MRDHVGSATHAWSIAVICADVPAAGMTKDADELGLVDGGIHVVHGHDGALRGLEGLGSRRSYPSRPVCSGRRSVGC